MNQARLLTADQIRALLIELGHRLEERGISARLFLVGGAAMALAFNTRRSTRDLDGVFEPKAEVYAEAAAMAEEYGLTPGWLNDGVKGLLPDKIAAEVGSHFNSPGISVGVASAEYLFAMKSVAAREEADAEDLRLLAAHLGLTDAEEALDLVERYFSPNRLHPNSQLFVESIFDNDTPIIDAPSEPVRRQPIGTGRVKPYRRKDGTVVKGHRRRRP